MLESVVVVFVYREGVDPTDRSRALWSFAERTDGYDPRQRPERSVGEEWSLSYRPEGTDGRVRVLLESFAAADEWFLTPDLPALAVTTDIESFRLGDGQRRQETLDAFLDVVAAIYTTTDPAFVYGHTPVEAEILGEFPDHRRLPVDRATLGERQVGDVGWLLLFPPAFVERYGREWLLDAPVSRTRLLDGAVLLLADEEPWEGDPERSALRAYFGVE